MDGRSGALVDELGRVEAMISEVIAGNVPGLRDYVAWLDDVFALRRERVMREAEMGRELTERQLVAQMASEVATRSHRETVLREQLADTRRSQVAGIAAEYPVVFDWIAQQLPLLYGDVRSGESGDGD